MVIALSINKTRALSYAQGGNALHVLRFVTLLCTDRLPGKSKELSGNETSDVSITSSSRTLPNILFNQTVSDDKSVNY